MVPSFDIMAHLAVETLRISVPTVIDAAFGMVSTRVCDERLDSWSRRLVEDAGIHLEVSGQENLSPEEGYVVMSNHQSHYDIPVLFQALPIPMRMVAKKEIFRIPFMGCRGLQPPNLSYEHSAQVPLIQWRGRTEPRR